MVVSARARLLGPCLIMRDRPSAVITIPVRHESIGTYGFNSVKNVSVARSIDGIMGNSILENDILWKSCLKC